MQLSTENSTNNCLPIVVYSNLHQIVKLDEWEFENVRIQQIKTYCEGINELLLNSNYAESLNKIASMPHSQSAMDDQHLINLVINDVNAPSIFKEALKRVWHYMISELQMLLDFITFGYENLTKEWPNIAKSKIIKVSNLLFKNDSISKKYFSLIKINNKFYQISTSELIILSCIKECAMWYSKVSCNKIVILCTHGIKDYSFGKFSKFVTNYLERGYIHLEVDKRRTIEEGITIAKADHVNHKLDLVKSLQKLNESKDEEISKLILDTIFVQMQIRKSFDVNQNNDIDSIYSKLMSMIDELNIKTLNFDEVVAIAITSGEPIKLLSDLNLVMKSKCVSEICDLLNMSMKSKNHLISIGTPNTAIDVTKIFITSCLNSLHYFDNKCLSLNTYLKLKIILLIEKCSIKFDSGIVVTSQWGTQIPLSIIDVIIDFVQSKFVEPQIDGSFEFDLNKFELLVHFK